MYCVGRNRSKGAHLNKHFRIFVQRFVLRLCQIVQEKSRNPTVKICNLKDFQDKILNAFNVAVFSVRRSDCTMNQQRLEIFFKRKSHHNTSTTGWKF